MSTRDIEALPPDLPQRPGWYCQVLDPAPRSTWRRFTDRILRRQAPGYRQVLVHTRHGRLPVALDPERPFFRVTRALTREELAQSKCPPADLMRLKEIEAAREFLLATGVEPWPLKKP